MVLCVNQIRQGTAEKENVYDFPIGRAGPNRRDPTCYLSLTLLRLHEKGASIRDIRSRYYSLQISLNRTGIFS
jgi:hypothetical protein